MNQRDRLSNTGKVYNEMLNALVSHPSNCSRNEAKLCEYTFLDAWMNLSQGYLLVKGYMGRTKESKYCVNHNDSN